MNPTPSSFDPNSSPPAAGGWRLFLALSLLVLLAYGLALRNGFVFDDVATIVANSLITDWRTWPDLFSRRYFLLAQEASYRPVVTLTYYLDYALWGRNPAGFHLTNLLLHLAAVLLLYRFAAGVLRAPRVAAWAAALFAAHPMLSEAVNAISFREDLLALDFMLLALLCLPPAQRGGRGQAWGLAAALVATALALLSKEMAVTLPLLAILAHRAAARAAPPAGSAAARRASARRRSWPAFSALSLLTLLYLGLRFTLLQSQTERRLHLPHVGALARLLTAAQVVLSDMLQMLWPAAAQVEYPARYATPDRMIAWAALVLVGAALLGTARLWRRSPGLAFGPAWFFVTLAPVSNLVAISHLKADRYLYVPALGYALFAASLAEKLGARGWPRRGRSGKPSRLAAAVLTLTLMCYVPLSMARAGRWRSDAHLWRGALQERAPGARSLNNLGLTYAERLAHDKAFYLYARALRVDPRYQVAWNNLGNALLSRGRKDRAALASQRALLLDPAYAHAHTTLGVLLEERGRLEQALRHYAQAAALNPGLSSPLNNIGVIFFKTQRWRKALAAFRQAQHLEPGNLQAAENAAGTLYRLGLPERALAAYRFVLSRQSGNAAVRANVRALERLLRTRRRGTVPPDPHGP
ncbi:MAG: tetratricopeptide repeat protein [Candidatus Tectomicrobia bacterium]|nr:tetratricopeptide repeat protein [Candidatus Tectomicrobia bacterium]